MLLLLFAVGNAKPTKIKEVSSINTAHPVSELQRLNAGVELIGHISMTNVLFFMLTQMHSMEKLQKVCGNRSFFHFKIIHLEITPVCFSLPAFLSPGDRLVERLILRLQRRNVSEGLVLLNLFSDHLLSSSPWRCASAAEKFSGFFHLKYFCAFLLDFSHPTCVDFFFLWATGILFVMGTAERAAVFFRLILGGPMD